MYTILILAGLFVFGASMNYSLHKGDCLVEMNNLQDNSIDMVLCDLPYGMTACKWDCIIPFDKLWGSYKRVCKENAAIVLFGSEPFSSHLRLSNIKEFKYDWIWHKNTGSNFVSAKSRPLKYHEIISVFYNKQPVYNPQFQPYSSSTTTRYKTGDIMSRSSSSKCSTIPISVSYEDQSHLILSVESTQKVYSSLIAFQIAVVKSFIRLKSPLIFLSI